MSPEEFIERLEKFNTSLEVQLPKQTATQATNLAALIVHRVQEQGLNAREEQLGVYTSPQYKKKREKAGRQTEYVDLTYTRGGAGMFGSTGIVSESNDNGLVTVVVAGRDQFTQDKLDWNSARYGDVLAPTIGEENLVIQSFETFLSNLKTAAGL